MSRIDAVRRTVTAIVVVAFEVYAYTRYARYGAEFHFWLHGLFGLTVGLVALTGWRLLRRRSAGRVAAWEAGLGGHLVSATPDLLFLFAGVLHASWMDVFALHIVLHFVPYPLTTQLLLLALALTGYGAVGEGRRRLAASVLTAAVLVTALAVGLRQPVPERVADIPVTGVPGWLCPLVRE